MWMAIALGFIGIVFVLQPGKEIFSLASILALFSGFFSALSLVAVRFLTREFSLMQILFFNSLIGAVVLALIQPFRFVPFDVATLGALLLVGFFGFTNQLLTAMALAKTKARIVTSLTFLSVIFGSLFDIFLFHNRPDWVSALGGLTVILAGILTIFIGSKESNN